MSYADAGHRPHADHRNEPPENHWDLGPYGLTVTLDTWGPQDFMHTMADYLQSNWGDAPSRLRRDDNGDSAQAFIWAEKAFKGQTLSQVLEGLSFWFTIDGVCRAATHQIVRTRVGAGFMQHGGRDNDWRHRKFSIPETVRRLVLWADHPLLKLRDLFRWMLPNDADTHYQLFPPISEPEEAANRLENYVGKYGYATLAEAITDNLERNRELYAALVDVGVPWQDARRFLPMGTQTYIHAQYNYLALKGVLANRLEHIMDWEINCVAQLMLRELRMKCPPMIWQSLGSHSDAVRMAKFAGLESWPPDGKWPAFTEQCACGHARGNHEAYEGGVVCEVGHCGCQEYRPVDSVKRTHRREQMPFWVLAPESLAGGPVRWIPTNGTYPQELK